MTETNTDKNSDAALPFETLPALFDHAVERYGRRVALKSQHSWGYQSITYGEMGRLISYLGTGLIERGLEKGDRVVLIADNSPEWCLVYAAVTSAGGVVVPLEIHMKENEIRHLMLHCEAKFLVTSPQIYGDRIEGMNLQDVLVIVIGEKETEEGGISLGEVMAEGKERINSGSGAFFNRKAGIVPKDVAVISYTSGTTGQPKGVVLLHRNLVSNAKACLERFSITEDDIFLCLLPLYHTFATTTNFLVTAASGSSVAFARSLKSRDIREDMEREKITVLIGVPLLFDNLAASIRKSVQTAPALKRILFKVLRAIATFIGALIGKNIGAAFFAKQRAKSGLGSIRFCVSGAAALRRDIEDAISSIGLPILQGYGLTEASPVVAANPPQKIKKGTVGPALGGVEVKLSEPNEEGIGEVIVRGDNVMKEYWRNSEATRKALKDGWLYTGDLGTLDKDGYLTIVGRHKDIIVTSGGKNVMPQEIEQLLGDSPFILESIVLGAKDKKGNDRVAAIIVPDYDALGSEPSLKGNLTEEAIKNVISEEIKKVCMDLPDYKKIFDFQIRDEELPKTPTRKVKRHLVTWIKD